VASDECRVLSAKTIFLADFFIFFPLRILGKAIKKNDLHQTNKPPEPPRCERDIT
jgi:hypothetical protein